MARCDNPKSITLLAVTASGTAPASSYGHDNNGNIIMSMTRPTNSGVLQSGNVLAYDAEGRLASTTTLSGTVIAQSYNAEGLRSSYSVTGVGQSGPGLSEQFQYAGGQLVQMTMSISGTVSYFDTHVYAQDGSPLALLRTQNGTTSRCWYLLDGRGSVVGLVDGGGNVVDQYAYDLWGAPTTVIEQVPRQMHYRGYWYDTEWTRP